MTTRTWILSFRILKRRYMKILRFGRFVTPRIYNASIAFDLHWQKIVIYKINESNIIAIKKEMLNIMQHYFLNAKYSKTICHF